MLEPGTLTGMKSLVGAFLAIMAVNSAPGLPAGLTTYLTVLVAAIALGAFFVSRRIKKKRGHASVATPAPPSPTIVQYIYTTGPVVTATPSTRAVPDRCTCRPTAAARCICPDPSTTVPRTRPGHGRDLVPT